MKEMGIFGLMIPEEYGGLGESLLTYALCVEEIARGWMSVSGIINTHFIVAYMLLQHGTEEQKQRYLPRMATGEVRGAFSMSEPGLGSDVAAIKSKAVAGEGEGEDQKWTVNAQKMWLTNGGSSNLVAVLVKTDLGESDSPYKNMTTFLVEKESGFGETAQGVTVPGKIEKMGYKGVDTTELILEGHETTTAQILGGEPGKGFYQMMDGVEVGRVNVAARACGVALRAFELGIAYAQQRETFGKKIAEHQAILFRLADMATKVEASHQMMVKAARLKDAGQRNDLEAGMAKYLAAENCADVVEQSFRIHGGYGYSKEYEIERLYREAPMLLIGEGTAEIQKMIIGRRLLEDFALKQLRPATSRHGVCRSARPHQPPSSPRVADWCHEHAAESPSAAVPRGPVPGVPDVPRAARHLRQGPEGRRLPVRPRVPGAERPDRRHRPQAARAGDRPADPQPGRLGGLVSGAWLGLFVGLIFSLLDTSGFSWASVLLTVAFGAVFGLVWALIGYALTGGNRDFTSVMQVVATQYEVLVEHKFAAQARELITKMDPMAAAQAQVDSAPGRPASAQRRAAGTRPAARPN